MELKDLRSGNLSKLQVDGKTEILTGSFSTAGVTISGLPVGHGILTGDVISYSYTTSPVLITTGVVGLTNANSFETGLGVMKINKAAASFVDVLAVRAAFTFGMIISFQSGTLSGQHTTIRNAAILGGFTAVDGAGFGDSPNWWVFFDETAVTGLPTYPTYTSEASINVYQGIAGSFSSGDQEVATTASTSITIYPTFSSASFSSLTVKRISRISGYLNVSSANVDTFKIQGISMPPSATIPTSDLIDTLKAYYMGYNDAGTLIASQSPFLGEIAAVDALFSGWNIYDVMVHPMYSNIGVIYYYDTVALKNYIRTFTYSYDSAAYTFNTAFEIIGSDTVSPTDTHALFCNTVNSSSLNITQSRLVIVGGKATPGTSVYVGMYTISNTGVITETTAWANSGVVIGAGTFTGILKARDLNYISNTLNDFKFIVLFDIDRWAMFSYIGSAFALITDGQNAAGVNPAYDYFEQNGTDPVVVSDSGIKHMADVAYVAFPDNNYATYGKLHATSDSGKISLFHIPINVGMGMTEYAWDGGAISTISQTLVNRKFYPWPDNFQDTTGKDQNIVFETESQVIFYKSLGYIIVLDKQSGAIVSVSRSGSNTYLKSSHKRISCLINGNTLLVNVGASGIANKLLGSGPVLAYTKTNSGAAVAPKSGETLTTSFSLIKGKEYGIRLTFNAISTSMILDSNRTSDMIKKFGIALDTNKFYVY